MRITIDARMMGPANTRGIGRYTEELVRAMLNVAPHHRYILLMRDPSQSPFLGHPSVEHIKADIPWYGAGEQWQLPSLLKRTKPDIVHVPHWNVPLLSNLPRVVTIHDLILLSEPASANITTRGPLVAGLKRLGYRYALRSALMDSRRILVPTQWVANDIKRHFKDVSVPIDITGEGMPDLDPTTWRDPDPSDQYLLSVGSAYPHKNLDALVDAWRTLAVHHPNLWLVMAGDLDQFMRRLQARVETEGIPRVRFLGRVTDQELSRLYSQALALVFPSRNEGFGLPPLEALAHGCPVVAARASCLPEVLGERAVIFFQPEGADAILQAVETVLRDPVGARERARQAAPQLRQRHDWRRTAEYTLEAYEKAVSEGR